MNNDVDDDQKEARPRYERVIAWWFQVLPTLICGAHCQIYFSRIKYILCLIKFVRNTRWDEASNLSRCGASGGSRSSMSFVIIYLIIFDPRSHIPPHCDSHLLKMMWVKGGLLWFSSLITHRVVTLQSRVIESPQVYNKQQQQWCFILSDFKIPRPTQSPQSSIRLQPILDPLVDDNTIVNRISNFPEFLKTGLA